ncbi:hypothetical protein [Ponticaulis sp.]|uniref:hypothetical protein n=1 Tax=Ponticaulis sp. TaxID=2020902 RepID=UPI000B6D4608|nr:hypothetical protein [Ponticaulis sp.]MAI89961.1 hypothetical protein [Ponticaulis sp.]OUX99628.1 MAG: hypothetical protein CBB65_05925 [Hyphomonadaceae bacterium TMED5]|tara:strand:+ start:50043 stop:50786 length:744 start_codon:yes stop_codon:yes gene_type:complete
MLFPTFLRDANKTAMTMMQASMESAKTTQENMMRQGELMSKMEMPWKMNWTKGPMPVPTFSFTAASADSTREAFHLMADANMKAWEKAAEAYAAVPGWMKLPYKVPGEFWSKWFDQWQDGKFDGIAPANVEAMVETMSMTAANTSEAVAKSVETVAEEAETSAATIAENMPELLKAAKGTPDDLSQIKGIGPKLCAVLNDTGVFHFEQIASWSPENIAWLDDKLAFKGRVQREGWVEQAQNLLKAAA